MRAATSLAAFLKTEFRNSCRLRSPGSGRSPASGCCTVSSGTRGSDRTTREPWSIVSSCSSGTARCCGRPPCSRLTSSGTQNWFHFYQIGWIGIDTNEANVRLWIFSEIRQWHLQNTFFLVIQIRYSLNVFIIPSDTSLDPFQRSSVRSTTSWSSTSPSTLWFS